MSPAPIRRARVVRRATLPRNQLYFRVPQIAAAAGMKVREMRDWLRRAKLTERRHGKLVVTAERIASEFPEAYRRLLESGDEND